MIGPPTNTQIWIAAGVTDLRRGFTGLSALVQTNLEQTPFSGQVFVFRGRRGDLIKLLWFDGDGLCLFSKRPQIIVSSLNQSLSSDKCSKYIAAPAFPSRGIVIPVWRRR